ncbi:hypothetical protein FACS1894172_15520 [Spirochaetia bacterium]|nr:hypothetical protein FACS1894164_12260 [Spirochaetia bacterium]GHU34774.1 hypothetical protein FACS1894172_15520 [Spirochaetia bacterium]
MANNKRPDVAQRLQNSPLMGPANVDKPEKVKKTSMVMVRLEPDDYESLQAMAQNRGVSAGTLLRILFKNEQNNERRF